MFPLFAWLWRACISIESLAQRLHKLHLSQVSGAYYTLSGDKLSRGVSEKICGEAGSGCSVSSRVTLSPSALRTTSLVYPGSLNPITGCAQDRSHGESHPSPHSHPSPPRRWKRLREAGRTGAGAETIGNRPRLSTPPPPPRRWAELREAGRTGDGVDSCQCSAASNQQPAEAGAQAGEVAGPGQEDITTMGSFRGLAGCRLGNDGRRRGFAA